MVRFLKLSVLCEYFDPIESGIWATYFYSFFLISTVCLAESRTEWFQLFKELSNFGHVVYF